MSSPRGKATKAVSEPAIPKPAAPVAGDEHATPWDEPAYDWGRRGYGQLRVIAKACVRDRFYGTW